MKVVCLETIDFLTHDIVLFIGYITDTHYTEEFLKEINAPEIQALYGKTFVSNYPKTSPAEFVADTFGRQMDGASIAKELLNSLNHKQTSDFLKKCSDEIQKFMENSANYLN